MLEDHFLSTTSASNDALPSSAGVSKLCLYPIKSCAPMALDSSLNWPLTETGLQWDRKWAVMDGQDRKNRCLNQKNLRSLCLVTPSIDREAGTLTLNYPKMEPITIPIDPSSDSSSSVESPCVRGRVCNESMEGVDCGDKVAEWLEEVTGKQGVRLVKQSTKDKR